MVLPLALLLLIFVAGLLLALAASVGYLPSLGMYEFTLDYYLQMFSRHDVLRSLGLSLYIAFASALLALVLGVLIAALITASNSSENRLLHLLKLPIIVPHPVCALLMLNLLSQNGLIARVLFDIGLIGDQQGFLAFFYDPASIGVIVTYLWKEIPFVFLVVVTVMARINGSLGQAAQNLGASRIKSFFAVTLPLSLPAMSTAFIIVFAYSFGAYEVPFLLGATEPKALPVLTYVEFVYPDLAHRPYAMVLDTVMIVFSVAVTYVYYKLQQALGAPASKTGERQ
jgi:putative spermidine/putrescine transport system permease protein